MRKRPTKVDRHHRHTERWTTDPDPALVRFLHVRILERLPAAEARRATTVGADHARADRAVKVLQSMARHLETEDFPEPTVMRLLTHTFRHHPRFRPEWVSTA